MDNREDLPPSDQADSAAADGKTGILTHILDSSTMTERNFSETRDKLLNTLNCRIRAVQASYHEDLAELSFIQSGSLLIDFPSWKKKRPQELMQALCSGHLDPEDLSMISSFISGNISPEEFFCNSTAPAGKSDRNSDDDSDDDEVS